MSPFRQDQFIQSHPSAASISDVKNYDAGHSVRRATGSISNAPLRSTPTKVDRSLSCLNDFNSKSLSASKLIPCRKRKVVQHGVINQFPPVAVSILFESIPWWIYTLDEERLVSLHFPQYSSYEDLSSTLQSQDQGLPILRLINTFDKALFHFNRVHKPVDLVLICGRIQFFTTLWNDTGYPSSWIFCTDVHQKLRFLPEFPFKLHRAVHHHYGGPTKYEFLWSSSCSLEFPRSDLLRTIGDFLDFSIRPQPCSQSPLSKHFETSSLLPVQGIFSTICYPTHFSYTGFGVRALTASELAHVFGVPSKYVHFFELGHFPFPPIQILDGLFDSWSRASLSSVRKIQKVEFCVPTPSPIEDSAPVFLHDIKKLLPAAWSFSAPSADKAAKADDAAVNFSMWDNRITMIWPRAHLLVPALRKLLLRRQQRLMYIEFQTFLRRKYGPIRDIYFSHIGRIYDLFFCNHTGGSSTCIYTHRDASQFDIEIKRIREDLKASKFYQLRTDVRKGTEGLHGFCESSFFNWNKGSSLFFWRWHPGLQRVARDGFPAQINSTLPNSYKKSRPPKANVYQKILSKLNKSLSRGYLIPERFSKINNLIDFFAVPKAEDIRMVQNGSSCGLNKAVWASNFWLPNASSMTRVLGFNYKAVDLDLGEMFLNFPLHKELVSYSGMDLSPYKRDLTEFIKSTKFENSNNLYVVNGRNWMGLRPSPEWSCRFYYLAEEFIRGNEKEPQNPLRWDRVVLNLIGNSDFNPALPNVFKWNEKAQKLAGEIKAYVDDLRALGWSLEHAWQIAHLIACRLQFLGIQDAARKRRIDQGPWAGAIYLTNKDSIKKTVTQEKWDKAKNYISDIQNCLKQNSNYSFNFKYLEQVRGFLCHLALTFEIIFPFLKGFHLTLCSHLPRRNEEGWKINELEWLGYMEEAKIKGTMSVEEIDQLINLKYDPKLRPNTVKPLPRFLKSISALESLFSCREPPKVTVRTSAVQFIVYGFADASKSGFGSSIEYSDGVCYRIGTWSRDDDCNSSNFREFSNIVETIEEEVEAGKLKNTTLILATDNTTVESALYKGNSTSELLFDLVVRFKTLELQSGSRFIVTHVSGERMKYQGTDGISRGQLREGISLGTSMISYCPWGLSASQRSPEIISWCRSTFDPKLEVLTPCQWFTRGHDHDGGYYDERKMYRLNIRHGTYLWEPPPAAADAALEEIRKARLKRRASTHIILVPRLCTTLWLKQLYKASDIVLYLPACNSPWPSTMFEPIVIGILFPYSRYYPWQFKGTPRLLAARREMQKLLQEANLDSGSLLHEFFTTTRKISSLSEHLVRKLLFFGKSNGVPYSSAGGTGRKRQKRQ